jgi:multidrug transporter EmrE-like cation transporter
MLPETTLLGVTATIVLAAAIVLKTANDTLTISLAFAVMAGIATWWILPGLQASFIKANIVGKDLLKKDRPIM